MKIRMIAVRGVLLFLVGLGLFPVTLPAADLPKSHRIVLIAEDPAYFGAKENDKNWMRGYIGEAVKRLADPAAKPRVVGIDFKFPPLPEANHGLQKLLAGLSAVRNAGVPVVLGTSEMLETAAGKDADPRLRSVARFGCIKIHFGDANLFAGRMFFPYYANIDGFNPGCGVPYSLSAAIVRAGCKDDAGVDARIRRGLIQVKRSRLLTWFAERRSRIFAGHDHNVPVIYPAYIPISRIPTIKLQDLHDGKFDKRLTQGSFVLFGMVATKGGEEVDRHPFTTPTDCSVKELPGVYDHLFGMATMLRVLEGDR